jgi:predicted dehydrogenase
MMTENGRVRIGLVGVGIMGSMHAHDLSTLPNTTLAAICDIDHERADRYAEQYGVQGFYDYQDMLNQVDLDAVMIATPHYFHTPISIAALERGLNVMTEKPLAVHVKDGHKMIAAYEAACAKATREHSKEPIFAIMFQLRTQGIWKKVKQILASGELGKLIRVTWLITDWFRTQSYYNNGGWRATWKGEGGGVLLNQCPHNLDLYQWFFGLPKKVAGFASIGKYHHIEVEDEVTGYFEHENGMVGHFITTTAESPGTNRLEIVGENGKLTCEDGRMLLFRNQTSMLEFIQTSPGGFDRVPGKVEEISYEETSGAGHSKVTTAFANAILNGTPLIARAPEGINGLTLGNSMMLSSFLGRPVDLPFDADLYAKMLAELAEKSSFEKKNKPVDMGDITKSFGINK